MRGLVIARAGPNKTRTSSVTTVTLRGPGRETINLTIWTTLDSEATALEQLCRVGSVLDVVKASLLTKTNGHPETLDPVTTSNFKLKFISR